MKKFNKCITLILSIMFVFSASVYAAPPCNDANGLADALYSFGLFNGTGTDADGKPIYSLDRSSTRQEAVVMLIRLLGKEELALQCNSSHPFTDVDSWADKYISYAYAENIAKGTSATLFGANQSVNAQQYLTFLSRALGYDDTKGDFSYDNVFAFSDSIGLTNGVYSLNENFLRSDVVWLSSGALLQNTKQGTPLIKELKKQGAITSDQYANGLHTMAVADLASDYCMTDFNSDYFDVRTLYTSEGQGEYSGYQRLRGYPNDELFQVYFTDTNNVDLKYNVNENEYITYSIDGVNYKKTRGELHELFFDGVFINKLNSDTSTWLYDIFGDVYSDWAFYYYTGQMESRQLVEKYLNIQNGKYYEPYLGFSPEEHFGLFNPWETYLEQELSAEWISEHELSRLSNESDLCFGVIADSMPDYYAGIGDLVYGFYLQGFSVEYLLCIYDMPQSFAEKDNAEGTYSDIRFKRENGVWFFNPQDLISVGLLNPDGTLNEQILEEEDYYYEEEDYSYFYGDDEDSDYEYGYNPNMVEKEFKKEWISSSELKEIYDFASYWAGEEIWIWKTALFGSGEEDIKFTLTGSPAGTFQKGKTYNCKYRSHTIRVQYDGGFDGGLLFDYSDLCDAGIIDEL